MIATDLYIEQIPGIYAEFERLVGKKHWESRVKKLATNFSGKPFLREYLIEENSLAYMLSDCEEYARGGWRIDQGRARKVYSAISFAAQTLSIIRNVPAQKKHKIVRRIHGAFIKPDDCRAMMLEFAAATHFARRGYAVSFPEMNDSGNFDLLVEGISDVALEVECKLVTNNKGRKIHQKDAIELHQEVKKTISHFLDGLACGLVVTLTIEDRLPKDAKSRS